MYRTLGHAIKERISLDKVVPARLRVDIIVRRQFFKQQEYYVVKDPLALTYFRLQPEEAYMGGLPSETLGWISVQRGRGVTDDGRVVNVFDTMVDHTVVPVPFGETLSGRFPSLVGQIVSVLGIDPVVLRYFTLTPDAVSLQLDEEQSANPETNHSAEHVSLFVAE